MVNSGLEIIVKNVELTANFKIVTVYLTSENDNCVSVNFYHRFSDKSRVPFDLCFKNKCGYKTNDVSRDNFLFSIDRDNNGIWLNYYRLNNDNNPVEVESSLNFNVQFSLNDLNNFLLELFDEIDDSNEGIRLPILSNKKIYYFDFKHNVVTNYLNNFLVVNNYLDLVCDVS